MVLHARLDVRLLIPEKLYGRDREIATLLSCFDRIIKTGVPELVSARVDTELASWRHSLLEALEPNGRLTIDLDKMTSKPVRQA